MRKATQQHQQNRENARGQLPHKLQKQVEFVSENPEFKLVHSDEIWIRNGVRVNPKKHQPGRVVHGMSFPRILEGFHGMWLYDMQDNLVSYGFVTMRRSSIATMPRSALVRMSRPKPCRSASAACGNW